MTPPEIQSIRLRLGMSQAQFARAVGLTGAHASRRVRGWEQGLYHPSGPAVEMIMLLTDQRNLEEDLAASQYKHELEDTGEPEER